MIHFCGLHDKEYIRHEKDGSIWYSHKLSTGKWCHEDKPLERVETREPVPEDIPFKPRDYDQEERGKCRFGLLVARAENIGIVALTQLEVDEINRQVDFAMTGKFSSLPEDIDDIELPSETVKEV